jgi:hypothetical protein
MTGRLRGVLTFANVCSFLALAVAISTGSAYAANTIFSTDIVDGEVKTQDLAIDAVTSSRLSQGAVHTVDLANASVTGGKIASNTLTAFDLAGGESNGAISLPASYVANGLCRDGTIGVNGAHPGDAVIASINGSVPQGILIYGVRVASEGVVTLKVCNLSGGTMAAVTNLPIAVVTISI